MLLDLRGNTGGLLTQAVAVAGLFISKGIVVSIQDEKGDVQHLRTLEGHPVWNGPLVILTDRASASASEIVAQALQDYGRAIIVGDDRTYGKGSFQTFTLNAAKNAVNTTGEYKVTRGRYYTVSGKTPQLVGVQADVLVPGPYSELDVGEKFLKFPLENHAIPASFDDQLLDIPPMQRQAVRMLYQYQAQPKISRYDQWLKTLQANSKVRIHDNKRYQQFLEELKKKSHDSEEDVGDFAIRSDFPLEEAIHVLQDLILFDRFETPASSPPSYETVFPSSEKQGEESKLVPSN